MAASGHRFRVSSPLRRSAESKRVRGKWAAVRGIAEENAAIVAEGGFQRGSSSEWIVLEPPPPSLALGCPAAPDVTCEPRFDETRVCVANVDSLSAALAVGDACLLSFANAETPGGRYLHGGRAQEEDLCRLLPQLHPSLCASGAYPLSPGTALLTRGVAAVRQAGSYALTRTLGHVDVITAAMPCGTADRRPAGGWAGSPWAEDVTLRIRSVLHAAVASGRPNVVLGAFGCGAFGNPAGPVAVCFRKVLASPEFRGCFQAVIFAVLDPLGTGNLGPFRDALGKTSAWEASRAT